MTISNTTDLPSPLMPSQQHNGKFRNTRPNQHKPSFGKTLQLMWKFLFNKPKDTVPNKEIPILSLSKEQLLSAPDRSLFRLGHSTILLKLQNEFWLTDPVFQSVHHLFNGLGQNVSTNHRLALRTYHPLKA